MTDENFAVHPKATRDEMPSIAACPNRGTQRTILLAGLVAFAVVGLFPPWKKSFHGDGHMRENPAGYGFIGTPPAAKGADSVQINLTRLFLQWIVLAVLVAAAAIIKGRSAPGGRAHLRESWDGIARRSGWRSAMAALRRRLPVICMAIAVTAGVGFGIAAGVYSARDLTGTTWQGSETLPGFGDVTFEFRPNDYVLMTDAMYHVKGKVAGRWSRSGSEVVITFQNCVYRGTIAGPVLSGTAYSREFSRSWQFSVKRS